MKSQLIPLQGTRNLRDLGGYKTVDGRTLRYKRLLRSDALKALTPEDVRILTDEYDLKWIIDLRGIDEARKDPDIVPKGVRYLRLPILRDHENAYGKESSHFENDAAMFRELMKVLGDDALADFLSMYRKLSRDPFCIAQYRRFFEILLAQENGSILWHCAAGKDRTGIIAAEILLALGVDLATVREDYLESTDNLRPFIDTYFDKLKTQGASDELIHQLYYVFLVFPEYFDTFIAAVTENWSGVDAFIQKGVGITSVKRQKLRELYLE